MTMRMYQALLIGAFALATASCGRDAATRDDAPQSSAIEVTDSGDVMTVELGRVEKLSAPQLTPTLLHSTRQRDIELFRVTAAVLLDGGGVALANSGTREVLLLADDGSMDVRAGGRGEGPGEFEEITSMVKSPGGFLVYDSRQGRMNEFTDSGDFVTSWSFKWRSRFLDLKPLARGVGGETLSIVGELRIFYPDGVVMRDTTPLLMFRQPEGDPDTLALLPAAEWSYYSIPGGGVARFEVGFGRNVVAFGREDRVVVGETGSLDLSVYRTDGTRTRRIRGDGGGGEVRADEVSAWRAEELAGAAERPPEIDAVMEKTPHNETFPAFETAVLGLDEMVWIGLHARPGDETRAWLVIGPDGEARGRMDLPAAARVLAVDTGRFVLVQPDELDVEDVRVYAY